MEKIRFVAIINPEGGNGLRYGAVVGQMLTDLDKELLAYQNQFNRRQGIDEIPGTPDDIYVDPIVSLRGSWESAPNSRLRLTLMLVDGAPAGIVMNTRYARSKYVSFWNFYIKPEFRGQGYGTKLLEHTLQTHRELGFKEMGLTVHDTNPRAEAFYRRYGFAVNTKEMFVAL